MSHRLKLVTKLSNNKSSLLMPMFFANVVWCAENTQVSDMCGKMNDYITETYRISLIYVFYSQRIFLPFSRGRISAQIPNQK